MSINLMNTIPAKIAKRIYRAHAEKRERDAVTALMREAGAFDGIKNTAPGKVRNVAFLIQGLPRFSGGATSILRIGTHLAENGFAVSYIDFSGLSMRELERNAACNLGGFKGTLRKLDDTDPDGYDVVIATTWLSFYRLGRFRAYKMYFVQDYEPYLCENYESALLAKATYEAGAHIVCLGSWTAKKIRELCETDAVLDTVPFPYEPEEYPRKPERDFDAYPGKQKIRIAVYAKEEGKRIPHVVQNLLCKAKEELRTGGIDLEILFFGYRKGYKPLAGRNLGLLSKAELQDLYEHADFGMCASMTNISLVTYEMIATGLPVIECKDGSFTAYFKDDEAILIDYDYRTFVRKLLQYKNDSGKLKEMTDSAYAAMRDASWEKTGDAFIRILAGLPDIEKDRHFLQDNKQDAF